MAGYIGAKVGTVTANAADIKGDISSTDTSPDLTLKNTTQEDIDGGRESTITFKGEQSGGELSTLAQIEASHDGTSDDEKSNLIFRTNDGSDGASPTEAMRINSSQNVGIGTTDTNGGRLVVGSAVSGDTSVIQVLRTGVTERTNFIGLSDSDALVISADENNEGSDSNIRFKVDGSEAMRIDSSQNVGIIQDLNIGNNDSSNPISKLRFGATQFGAADIVPVSSGHKIGLDFKTDGTGDTTIDPVTRMRIDPDGNVGIGTTSPSSFSGYTNLTFKADSSGSNLDFHNSSDTRVAAIVSNPSSELIIETTEATPFIFKTNSSEAMRIDSSGNKIMRNAAIPASNIDSGASTGSYFTNAGQFHSSRGTSSTSIHVEFMNSNGLVGKITTAGSGTAYNTSSDYRLKENITYDFDATTRLKQLKPARFNFIAEPDTTVDGFIAHEVSSIVPEAITGEKDAVKVWNEADDLPKDKDGKPTVSVGDNKLDADGNTIPEYQGIDQAKLVPLLTAALQEAITKIETLETKVAALEAE